MGTWPAIFDNDGDVHAAISSGRIPPASAGLLQEQGDDIFVDCDPLHWNWTLKEKVKPDPALR